MKKISKKFFLFSDHERPWDRYSQDRESMPRSWARSDDIREYKSISRTSARDPYNTYDIQGKKGSSSCSCARSQNLSISESYSGGWW